MTLLRGAGERAAGQPGERLRADAVAGWRAALAALAPTTLINRAVGWEDGRVTITGEPLPACSGYRLVVALGKAAPGLAAAWQARAPDWADEVLVLAPHGAPAPPGVTLPVMHGGHPEPDDAGAAATRRLMARLSALSNDDLVVVLLSGGASALLAAPVPGVSLADLRSVTRRLLAAGAPIGELNTVRRALLAAAGGGLARAAAPAAVVTLVLSDVLTGELADVASGPTIASPTGPADALATLRRHGLHRELPALARALDRPPDPAPPPGRVVLLAGNRDLREAAATHLDAAGYRIVAPSSPLTGEAAGRGRQLAALATALKTDHPTALVLGGETTVTVTGRGRGGRCQELALAAAVGLPSRGAVLLAGTSDGVDGASLNAGAVVDGGTTGRLRAAGIDPAAVLAANDSATALEAAGDALRTGPTGTNVADLVLLLTAPTGASAKE